MPCHFTSLLVGGVLLSLTSTTTISATNKYLKHHNHNHDDNKMTMDTTSITTTATNMKRSCGTVHPGKEHMDASLEYMTKFLSERHQTKAQQDSPITVQVVFHMFDNAQHDYFVPTSSLETGIAQMNQAYSGAKSPALGVDSGFRFTLKGINRIITDTNTITHCDSNPTALQDKYWIPGGDIMNVMVCAPTALGFSYMPCASAYNGVLFVHWQTFPPAPGYKPFPDFDETATLIHETGHTLGLYHTFEHDCNAPGDSVDDTPYNTVYYGDCTASTQRDSCPNQPGLDMLDNFMQYSVDHCMTRFSQGQVDRMQSETARCMNLRNAQKLCTTVDGSGTAHPYSVCRNNKCKFTSTPDGSPIPVTGWCSTMDGFWGACSSGNQSGCDTNGVVSGGNTPSPTTSDVPPSNTKSPTRHRRGRPRRVRHHHTFGL
jgi:hypothetical protein